MKKFILLLMSVLAISNFVFSQDESKAKGILDEVSAKTKAYITIKIDFTYSMENKEQKIDESKSGIINIKGDKYRLEIAGQVVICDGKTVWTYIKDANEVQINNVQNTEDALNPTKILTSYDKNYKPKFIKEGNMNGKTIQTIDMYPIKGKSYTKVRINIDKANKQISSSVVYDKKGNIYTYKVNKLTPNIDMPESMFTYKAGDFPGAEINDMR